MNKLKIGALIALIIFTIALVIGVAGIYIAGNIFDSRFESAISKIKIGRASCRERVSSPV